MSNIENRENLKIEDVKQVKRLVEYFENLKNKRDLTDFDIWFLYQFLNVPHNKADLLNTTIGVKSDNYIMDNFHYFMRGKNHRKIVSELDPQFLPFIHGRTKLFKFTGNSQAFNMYIYSQKKQLDLTCGDQLFRRLKGNTSFERYKRGEISKSQYFKIIDAFGHSLNTHQNWYTY